MAIQERVENQVVGLDYAEFRNTEFVRCKIVYKGGRPPILVGNNFHECEWIFDAEAANTVEFLKALGAPQGGGADLVRKIIFGD